MPLGIYGRKGKPKAKPKSKRRNPGAAMMGR
jgi:hypothetical protein